MKKLEKKKKLLPQRREVDSLRNLTQIFNFFSRKKENTRTSIFCYNSVIRRKKSPPKNKTKSLFYKIQQQIIKNIPQIPRKKKAHKNKNKNKTNPEERKRERNTPEILIFGTSLEKLKTQKRKPQQQKVRLR